jgi:serine/threonine protein phosphatase PrpC
MYEPDPQRLSATSSVLPESGPASSRVKVELAGATHPGHVRDNNEDHYLAVRFRRSLKTLCTNLQENTLDRSFDEIGYGLLAADGIGGMAAGEVASQLALRKLVELVVNTPDWIMKFNQPEDENTVTLHHILTAALGTACERTDPQVLSFRLSHNDQVLLCTDGLTEMVSAETIACVLSEASSSRFACDSLIDLALSAGGVDNVTVVLARYEFQTSRNRQLNDPCSGSNRSSLVLEAE